MQAASHRSRHLYAAYCAALASLWLGVSPSHAGLAWLSPELRRLEAEKSTLEQSLEHLPAAPVPNLTKRLGWHSVYAGTQDSVEWVELTLARPEKLDAVVLVAPPPSGSTAQPGYGFPLRFRVELLGEGEHAARVLIADHTREDFPNPGLLPVVIPAGGRTAFKVRITATKLYQEDQRFLMALGEVMLLQGEANLGARIETVGPPVVLASSSQGTRPDWGRINMVDGHTVLGPPLGPEPSPTLGFRSRPNSERRTTTFPWVEVDLGAPLPVDEVRLFPAHPPEFAHSPGYGFPVSFQMELRETEDALRQILPGPQSGSYTAPPGDNVVTIVAGGQVARTVRLTVLDPHVSNGSVVLALAEMQVWSGGGNVALGKAVRFSDATEANGWSPAALVDGFASTARIADWPGWLGGLSQRRERLHQIAVINSRQQQVERRLQVLGGWLAGALLLVLLMVMLTSHLRQRRARRLEVEALHQRISQDLHDEIGSSLGSIVLITEEALSLAKDDDLKQELGEIRDTARQTLDSMRDIVRLAQTGAYGRGDLIAHLQEIAGRMLRGIPYELATDPGADVSLLPMDQRRDLVLMFKETLHNLLRHAQATHARITVSQSLRELTVTIQDNGRGFDPAGVAAGGMGLTNLQRRAGKHGGAVAIISAPGQGATIRITLPRHA